MDDPDAVEAAEDTTMALVEELRRRGHFVALSLLDGLHRAADGLLVETDQGREVAVASFDAVLVRADPPFDMRYLQATLLLEEVRGGCLVVNDPRALRDGNEKLLPLRFPALTPPTMVTADEARVLRFLAEQGGRLVIKPTDGCGGQGVFVADEVDPNLHAIIEAATGAGQRRVIAQRYLPAPEVGDKRIILLDGEPIGALLRRPAPGQARANLHSGGTAQPAELTARDREIVAVVGDHCRREGLYLVGLDVIDGWLTEVNVTSPAGFRMFARLTGVRLEVQVVDWLEDRCATRLRRLRFAADHVVMAA